MAQVSVADVDNLEDAYNALSLSLDSARETYQSDSLELSTLADNVAEVFKKAAWDLEQVRELEEQRKACVEDLRADLERASAALGAAEAELSRAEDDLSNACSQVDEDEDGNTIEPDTSAEESAVAEAEAEVECCREDVEDVTAKLEEAEQTLAETTERRCKCEEIHEMAYDNDMKARQLMESFCASQKARLVAVEQKITVVAARLQRAQQALEHYLAANSSAAIFASWVHWKPVPGQPIMPQNIHDRLHLTQERQNQLARYLYYRDPVFRSKIDGYKKQILEAYGSAERNAVLIQASRGGSGDFAERMVKFAFAPIGTVSTQDRRYFEGGRYTKIDLVVKDFRNPVILGKGLGMGAPAGGSIAVEVKTGRPDYLYNQKDHMVFQAGGHQDCSASVTICSGDIHNLSKEKEKELRDAMRDAGSPIVGMLPTKDEIDETIWQLICEDGKESE